MEKCERSGRFDPETGRPLCRLHDEPMILRKSGDLLCAVKNRARHKRWREKNPEQVRARHLIWRAQNLEECRAKSRQYRESHLEEVKERQKHRYWQLREKGLCVQCGKNPGSSALCHLCKSKGALREVTRVRVYS